MPVTSKAQWRFMQAAAHGDLKKKGLSKEKAEEFIRATPSYKKLPEQHNENHLKRLKKMFGRK